MEAHFVLTSLIISLTMQCCRIRISIVISSNEAEFQSDAWPETGVSINRSAEHDPTYSRAVHSLKLFSASSKQPKVK